MPTSLATHKRRVKRGAALLDEEYPGWADRVEVLSLDMSDPCKCMLGQVCGPDAGDAEMQDGFEFGVKQLGGFKEQLTDAQRNRANHWSYLHGFDFQSGEGDGWSTYDTLKTLWVAEIEARRGN